MGDQFTDEQIVALDPGKFTIAKIKSILAARDVDLPPQKVPKEEYVQIFKNYQDTLKKGKKRKTEGESVAESKSKKSKSTEEDGTPTTPPDESSSKTSASTSKKRRKSSNIFQQRLSPAQGEEGDEETKKRKSRKSMPAMKVEFAPIPSATQPTPQATPVAPETTPSSVPSTPLPFPILQETLQSSTPYNFNTPLPYNASAPTPDSNYNSTYTTPKTPNPSSAQNAGRTPYSQPSSRPPTKEYDDVRLHRANELQHIIQQQHRGRRNEPEESTDTPDKAKGSSSSSSSQPTKPKRSVRIQEDDEVEEDNEAKTAKSTKEKKDQEQHKREEQGNKREQVQQVEEQVEEKKEELLLPEEVYQGAKPAGVPQYIYLAVVALLWAFIVVTLALFLFHEIAKAPHFCDTGVVSPDCVTCPPHGICYGGKLLCNNGYVQSGLICIEDEEVNRQANSIADSAYFVLREARGKYECHEAQSKYLSESDIKDALLRTGRYSESKFVTAFPKALLLLSDSTRFNVTRDGDVFCAHDPIYSVWCEITTQAHRHWLPLLLALGLSTFTLVLYIARQRREKLDKRANQLARLALAELRQKKALYDEDKVGEPFVVVTHLRDQLLRGEERDDHRLWRAVETIVRRESRVTDAPAMLHGTQEITWEWTGTTASAPVRSSLRTQYVQPVQPVDRRYTDIFAPRTFRG